MSCLILDVLYGRFPVSVIQLWWPLTLYDGSCLAVSKQTRTTRTPAFWGYPRRPMIIPILLIHIESQVKTRQSQNYKFKEFAKTSNLKLLHKMCKYPASIVEDTERTRFCPQTDRRADRRTDRRSRWNQYTSISASLKWGYDYLFFLPKLALLLNAPSGSMYTNNWIVLGEYETHADGKIWNPEP